MTKQTIYSQTLASLNKAQKEAVESIEGPLMIVAGPGTGRSAGLRWRGSSAVAFRR